MEFALLDGLKVTADGVDLTPSRPKQRTLLAYLLLHTGEVVSTDDLVDAVWGERPPDTALTALHGRIHRHLGDRLDTAVDLSRAARNLAFADKADIAVRLISSFQVMRGEIGVRRSRVAEMNEQTLTTVRRQLGEAAFAEAWQRGQVLTIDAAVALVIEALDEDGTNCRPSPADDQVGNGAPTIGPP